MFPGCGNSQLEILVHSEARIKVKHNKKLKLAKLFINAVFAAQTLHVLTGYTLGSSVWRKEYNEGKYSCTSAL